MPLARLIGNATARTVSVLIHKPSIADPLPFQLQAFSLYRYASRLLVERVSWLCRDHRRAGAGDGRVELIYSNRSAMSYEDLCDYLRRLRDGTEANGGHVDWSVIDPTLIRAVNHEQLAGLQLADTVASGVYFAANRNPYGEIEDRYLRLMARTLYRHQGKLARQVPQATARTFQPQALKTHRALRANQRAQPRGQLRLWEQRQMQRAQHFKV